MRPRLVIIGHGMAATRLLDELFQIAPDRYAVTVIGAEPEPGYNRIQLSSVLAGEQRQDAIRLKPDDWYAARGIALRLGDPAATIDRAAQVVTTRSGMAVPYDHLILATGSRPIILPVPGVMLPGVVAFRDQADVQAMTEAASRGGKAVVIGGGLLGLEAASGLARRGMAVTVVHLMPSLMERQLDAEAAESLHAALRARGISFCLGAETAAIEGGERVMAVRLKDGRVLPADLVVMAVGIRPETALAAAAGLEVKRGVLVGDGLATSDPNVSALGECIEHRGQVFGLVGPIWEQAKVLAARLAGDDAVAYAGSTPATGLKVSGIDLFSAGEIAAGDGAEVIVFRDPVRAVYKKAVLRGARLAGVVLYGEIEDGRWYADLVREGRDVATWRHALLFGRQFLEPAEAAE